ncbi:hypothetical protein NGRA_0955 [Nosema granulosis]|uniref:Uncharacterized protein n=1 Tax=Nosema granulosis TaxID=83296 RepID=A0A9P6H229_9MICR|nr:hypothetical protein NGRA_0955 [Nosema granulosis]
MEKDLEQHELLGGFKVPVQVGLAVLDDGKIITNPSKKHVDLSGCQWVIGAIQETADTRNKMRVIKDTTMESISDALSEMVKPESVIKTNNHPSFAKAIESISCTHSIVKKTPGHKDNKLSSNLLAHLKRRHAIRKTNTDPEGLADLVLDFS